MKTLNHIKKYFGADILRRSALNLNGGSKWIRKFMKRKPVDVALEIGTFRGVTSAWMSNFCKKLITIDLKDGLYEAYKEKQEWCNEINRLHIWDKLGITNIEQVLIKDNTEKADFIKSIDFDFVFIDGDHSYEGVKYDFEITKHCGRVLFHDYDKALYKDCPVRDYIETINFGKFEYTKDFAYWEA